MIYAAPCEMFLMGANFLGPPLNMAQVMFCPHQKHFTLRRINHRGINSYIVQYSASHGTDMLHCIVNLTKSLQLNNIHQTSQHAQTKTSACFVHYSGKTFQTLMRNLTNANVVKCRMKKFSSQTFQSLFQIHLTDHKMNTIISTYGVIRPAHLNSKCA